MISKKEYHLMISKLPKHKLSDDFERNIMEKLQLEPAKKAVPKTFYITACATLSIFLFLMISASLKTSKPSYTLIGENALNISTELSNSILSGLESQK